ncbi:efflux RND transporter periplasmic adaptor subunit [Accumulibacter sp.]|uniref:efflux RND transporter periplasmic adaptor subunit n=1 Tax=Accumulibacter sp. TaxID=2053492 RepID=UPI0025D2BFAB|nr:efflux RND transporter periplasmic adaptor subunit [Accumulibacter sp.]MCM8626300.1 efflux RND transporter periplasmic adaptor subunit [Accumulibacter sp.]
MRTGTTLVIGALAVAVAAGGGYWLGSGHAPSGEPAGAPAADGPTATRQAKVLYYRNPMGLPDTSPVPKKDPMGMDYIPVYEGEGNGQALVPGEIRIGAEKIQKLGVRSEAAELRVLDQVVRAAGRIEPDERRVYAIAPKFEGYVERLHVNVTGQPVGKGQALFDVYSPELVSAQREYAIAAQGVDTLDGAGQAAQEGMKELAESSLARLRNWDISEEQVRALAKSGVARRTLTLRSPVSGIVTGKKAVQGMRFMPGETLFEVADLSSVWVVADVFEQDIALLSRGTSAKVRIDAYPDRVFEGKVGYVYPALRPETRTVPVRVELPNPDRLLKPAMFAEVELSVGGRRAVLSVPTSAVIDSGRRRIVFVDAGEGRFEPREVRLGRRDDRHVEVLEGLRQGEAVVVAANFLIDAESNLQAAFSAFGHGRQPGDGRGRPAVVAHRASGTIDAIDLEAGVATISHGPVASLDWPAMTMDFQATTPALLAGLKPGLAVSFEFVERKPGEWVITGIQPAASGGAGAAGRHAGH